MQIPWFQLTQACLLCGAETIQLQRRLHFPGFPSNRVQAGVSHVAFGGHSQAKASCVRASISLPWKHGQICLGRMPSCSMTQMNSQLLSTPWPECANAEVPMAAQSQASPTQSRTSFRSARIAKAMHNTPERGLGSLKQELAFELLPSL